MSAEDVGPDTPGPHGYYPPIDFSELVEGHLLSDLGNIQYGDCVLAAIFHHLQFWTQREITLGAQLPPVVPTTSEALTAYHQVNPAWNPANGDGDDGCEPLDALKLAMTDGFVIGGMRRLLCGFAEIDGGDLAGLKYAIEHGVGVITALNLPDDAEDDVSEWKLKVPDWPLNPLAGASAPGGWGGHMVYTAGRNADAIICNSWGRRLSVSYDFMLAYAQRHYFLVWDSLQKIGSLPAAKLREDMIALRRGLLQS